MPSDWTHSSRLGTRFGPEALRKATTLMQSMRPQDGSFDPDTQYRTLPAVDWLVDCGDACAVLVFAIITLHFPLNLCFWI